MTVLAPSSPRLSDAPPTLSRHVPWLGVVGALAVVGVVSDVILGLWVTPPDQLMGNLVRLLYIHPAMAFMAFLAYGVTFLASLAYLWPRTRSLVVDRLAGASAEVGVVFTGLTLITGSIWGRPTWGAWWVWDPLLTTTALLFVLYLGYFSVSWWSSLHQAPTLIPGKTYVHGSMLYTLLLSFVAFGLVYVWLVGHRYRLAVLDDQEASEGLAYELDARRAEGQ
jgi:heme exporter protein C